MMKVLLTGSEGFIGKHVFFALRSLGMEVVCWDKKKGQNIVYQEVPAVDAVIHLAANLIGDFESNYFATQHLIGQKDKYQKFIFTSSAAVYGNNMDAKEDHILYPFGEYGQTKVREEQLILHSKVEHTILRLANVYGFGTDHGVYNYFINGGNVINGNGEQVRDFVHVDDVVLSIVHSLLSYSWTGTFNIGTGVPTTINKLFSLLNPNDTFITSNPKNEIQYSCLNIEKAEQHGYAPRHLRS